MTGSRKVLLAIVALAVPAYFLPLTRDEVSWWWTQSHDHSDNYLRYLSDWPDGRHAVEARVLCAQRLWAETKMAQIREANTTPLPVDSETRAAHHREQDLRRDAFLWKHATDVNTSVSYHDYLRQYPRGLHAAEARRDIEALGGNVERGALKR